MFLLVVVPLLPFFYLKPLIPLQTPSRSLIYLSGSQEHLTESSGPLRQDEVVRRLLKGLCWLIRVIQRWVGQLLPLPVHCPDHPPFVVTLQFFARSTGVVTFVGPQIRCPGFG